LEISLKSFYVPSSSLTDMKFCCLHISLNALRFEKHCKEALQYQINVLATHFAKIMCNLHLK